MALSNSSNSNAPSFLTNLSTLRDFVNGMGVEASEDALTNTLKNSGYNVELALERILTGNFGGSGGHYDGVDNRQINNCARAPSSSKSRKRIRSAASSSLANTPKLRQKYRHGSLTTPSSSGNGGGSIKRRGASKITNSLADNGPLLLCKRWTVACSKSTRGRVNYGETLDFGENWKDHRAMHDGGERRAKHGASKNKKKVMDPMVRFHSQSGQVEGTLDRFMCSVLSPLLRLSSGRGDEDNFVPLVTIEGEALMEDRSLVIGSDVPISLKVYLNDPLGFFDLFQHGSAADKGQAATSSKLFFQRKNTARKSVYTGKKSNLSEEDLANAAFRLLQWAERGEEMPLFEKVSNQKSKLNADVEVYEHCGKFDNENYVKKKENNDDDNSKTLCNDQVDGDEENYELNCLVSKKTPRRLPEMSDPEGFKSGVTLRPYQRQALWWMLRREGHRDVECETLGVGTLENGKKGRVEHDDEADDELDLLIELAGTTTSSSNVAGDPSIQVWGGGENAIACDCGPVLVKAESVACNAVPVIEYLKQKKEGDTDEFRRNVHHPLWKKRYLATKGLGSVYAFYVNELLGIASASPPNPPNKCTGGILADAMGLGKTVMLLSLILKVKELDEDRARNEREEEVVPASNLERGAKPKFDAASNESVDDELWAEERDATAANKPGLKPKGTTLVIAPLTLISQWEEELSNKTNLSHLVYYDSAKKGTSSDAFSCIDVVVTTYGTIQSEYASLTRSVNSSKAGSMFPNQNHSLLNFQWKRIILDEAHGIKNPTTIVSKACCMLRAESRWCVTGTPIQNSLQDAYGLLKFLRHEPWCEAAFWKNAIDEALFSDKAAESAEAGDAADEEEKETSLRELRVSAAFGRVRRVLAPIILRRTKDTLADNGTPILTLPPIDSLIIRVALSPPEREFYCALLERSQSVFDGLLNAGTASKSWFAIFSLLQRLRQSCDHVSLTVSKKLDSSSNDGVAHSLKGSPCKNERDESLAKNDGGIGTVDDSFLNDLIGKFNKKANKNVSTVQQAGSASSFSRHVAESLSQCVLSSDKYLKDECPICLDEPMVEDAVHTPCAHMFCKDCLLSEFREQLVRSNEKTVNLEMCKKAGVSNRPKVEGGLCPVCHDWVAISSIIQIKKSKNGETVSEYLNQSPSESENVPNVSAEAFQQRHIAAREALESALNGACSSKLTAILAELDRVWTSDPGSKVLVFSQYLGFLDIVGRALDDIGVTCFRIDGKMSLKERVAMIGKFNKKKSTEVNGLLEKGFCQRGSVFLVSMKAGGVGLNLVAASSVFIVDPWWNQAIEDQCINRIHRIGQQAKIVRVRKFVVTDSVEEKIVNLQGKKKGMANAILSDVDSGGHPDGAPDSTKPTLEDFKLLFNR